MINRIIIFSCFFILFAGSALADCDVKVARVVDGDSAYSYTLRIVSPKSGKVEWTRFRLNDVYAPERGEPLFDEAKADLVNLISGKRVEVQILPERDPRGGLIVNVYLCNGDLRTSVNEAMRQQGWDRFGKGVKR